ncbi:hypothetical protein CBF59_10370 [Lactobacillus taiwanensis]|nr:hypothetical protein CBF59_10370 [Lactobacillus taiwanensis]
MLNYSQDNENTHISNINHYLQLMKMSYKEAVNELQGREECQYDYFNRQSFKNLARKNFKSINKKDRMPNYNKNRSKYSEGLVLHHVYEIKFKNLSYLKSIRNHTDFMYQQKENLVYCNLLEHLILHGLIAKETKNKLGIGGYKSIPAQIEDLYSKEKNNKLNNQEKILLGAIGLEYQEYKILLAKANKLLNDG